MSMDFLWVAPTPQQWEALHQCSADLAQANWSVVNDWSQLQTALQSKPWGALILGSSIAAGVPGFGVVDSGQVMAYLRPEWKLPVYIVLEEDHSRWATDLEGPETTVLVDHKGRPVWPRLAASLLKLWTGSAAANPLRDVNEWVLASKDGQVLASFQSLDAELRTDLISFLQTKGRALDAGLRLGACRKITLQTERFVGTLEGQPDGSQLLALRHQARDLYPQFSGAVQWQELTERGVKG